MTISISKYPYSSNHSSYLAPRTFSSVFSCPHVLYDTSIALPHLHWFQFQVANFFQSAFKVTFRILTRFRLSEIFSESYETFLHTCPNLQVNYWVFLHLKALSCSHPLNLTHLKCNLPFFIWCWMRILIVEWWLFLALKFCLLLIWVLLQTFETFSWFGLVVFQTISFQVQKHS